MAFKGKLTAIDGRRLLFGSRKINEHKMEHGPYTHEFTLAQGGKVKRGTWPDFDDAHLSDLKNGMEVTVKGVAGDATSGECHTVIIPGKASHRNTSFALAERAEKIAAKKKK